MSGLVPAIHVFPSEHHLVEDNGPSAGKTRMLGTRPSMTVWEID
jgi:hypothetical protein